MRDIQPEWTEHDVCKALQLTRPELRRLVMQRIIAQPRRTYTGQLAYSQQQVDRLCQYLGRQDVDQRVQDLRSRWERDPLDTHVQAELLQLLAFRRLFFEGNRQGLHELWEHDSLASGIVYSLIDQLRECPLEDALFAEIIVLLYEKLVPQRHKHRR